MSEHKILVVDVGGNNVKIMGSEELAKRKTPSGPELTPKKLVAAVTQLADGIDFDRVTIGLPMPVVRNLPTLEPHNLGSGWLGFDFQKAIGKPTKVVNDALMQAMGSYQEGTILFLGLGTGLGAALVIDGVPAPLELAHMPYKSGRTYEDYVGRRGLKRMGRKRWQKAVFDVIAVLRAGMVADNVVIGGGNAKLLSKLPPHCRLGHNDNAFLGGFRMWDPAFAGMTPVISDALSAQT